MAAQKSSYLIPPHRNSFQVLKSKHEQMAASNKRKAITRPTSYVVDEEYSSTKTGTWTMHDRAYVAAEGISGNITQERLHHAIQVKKK